jgi:cellulose synthase/poly-beta-1,6-N-acetylglucosamine synthase-like glycosyltransferase
MLQLKLIFSEGLTLFNLLLASYFIAGNGVYTVLMVISLVSVWLHNRRLAYEGLDQLRSSTVTPPVTLIMPACNEQEAIVGAVRSALKLDYPDLQVIVVDDGSTDRTLERLAEAFGLVRMDQIYRPPLRARNIRGFFSNPQFPRLFVVSKENGGKPDALNVGINICRTPYFCTLDADCILERNALLRLMRPIIASAANVVASGGIIRILNGCKVRDGQVVEVALPATGLERFQVVEYLRSFLFGRTGWDLLGGTVIIAGAFAVFHRETVVEAGGFALDTVTEDMDLIVRIRRWAVDHKRSIRMSFTSDPVCWAECPASLRMLARQRRRWQLGLCQTLWKNSQVLFNPKFGVVGLLSFPFQLYVEALGAVVELLGYALIPFAFMLGMSLPQLYLPFVVLGLAYAAFLSVGSVVLEDLTHRRYPSLRDLGILILYALVENFGYRQLLLFYRFQGVVRFLTGFREWEKVAHVGTAEYSRQGQLVS